MKGILFNESTGMLAAVLSGAKTQTRRFGGLETVNEKPDDWIYRGFNIYWTHLVRRKDKKYSTDVHEYCKPRYKIGETVFIKESWAKGDWKGEERIFYRADNNSIENAGLMGMYGFEKWSNAMFCGEAQSRHKILITGIKVERLQDISDEDCTKEGIEKLPFMMKYGGYCYNDYSDEAQGRPYKNTGAKASFASLINKINGRGTWEANYWCFQYEFKLLK